MDFEYLNYQEALNSMATVVNNSLITPDQREAYDRVGIAIEEVVEEPTIEINTPSEEVKEEAVESNLEEVEITTSKKNKK